MRLGVLYVTAMILTALALALTGSHLFQIPSRLSLTDLDYIFIQSLGSGKTLIWPLLFGALLSDIALVAGLGRRPEARLVSLAALLMALGIFILLAVILPASRATAGWTVLPDDWDRLRRFWEYGHAVTGLLVFLAFCALTLAAPARRIASPPGAYRSSILQVR
jgi:hypothetical protein